MIVFIMNGCQKQRDNKLADGKNYHNPIDGLDYYSYWKEYYPADGLKKQKGPISIDQVVVLTEEGKVAKNISAESLAQLCKNIEEIVSGTIVNPTDSAQLIIQYTLTKSAEPQVKCVYKGELDQNTLQNIYDRLKALPSVRSISDEIKFQVHFTISK